MPSLRGGAEFRYDGRLGQLAQLKDARRHALTTETVIGRSPSADLRLSQDFVSSLHATLTYAGGHWGVRDLASHNGTGVNGEAVAPGARRRLRVGDELSFGQASETWTLVDDAEPAPHATAEGREPMIGENGLLVLPDADEPRATIFHRADRSWRLEDSEGERGIVDREAIVVDGVAWTIRLPEALTSTRSSAGARRNISLRDVTLTIVHDGEERGGAVVARTDSGDSLSFPIGASIDVLKVLAAASRANEGGWVDREHILDTLRITGNRLNVTVFRLRRQFTEAGFVDGAQIVERSHRRLRVGVRRVELE